MSAMKTGVLLVERHGFARAIAMQMLEQMGCAPVHCAQTAEEALQMLRDQPDIDVLLCNVEVLGADCLRVIRVAAAQKRVRAVVIAGSLDAEVRTGLGQWVSMLGLEYLGDGGSPLEVDKLHRCLKALNPRGKARVTPIAALELVPEELRQALDDDQLFPRFLPRCRVDDGLIRSVDVQLYWRHPQHGELPVEPFWPAAQRDGLSSQLLLQAARKGLDVQQKLAAEGLPIALSIDVHLEQLAQRQLISQLLAMLRAPMAGGFRVALELSNVGTLPPQTDYLETLLRVRLMGCDLGMQGFGFGGASLQRLCQWPINQLRLASPFLRDAPHQSRHLAVVQHTLVAARTLGIELTVTGVESSVHNLLLFDLGCRRGQGEYFAVPLSTDQLRERLRTPLLLDSFRRD